MEADAMSGVVAALGPAGVLALLEASRGGGGSSPFASVAEAVGKQLRSAKWVLAAMEHGEGPELLRLMQEGVGLAQTRLLRDLHRILSCVNWEETHSRFELAERLYSDLCFSLGRHHPFVREVNDLRISAATNSYPVWPCGAQASESRNLSRVVFNHPLGVHSVHKVVLTDGRVMILSVSMNRTAYIWDPFSSVLSPAFQPSNAAGNVIDVAVMPNKDGVSKFIAIARAKCKVELFDAQKLTPLVTLKIDIKVGEKQITGLFVVDSSKHEADSRLVVAAKSEAIVFGVTNGQLTAFNQIMTHGSVREVVHLSSLEKILGLSDKGLNVWSDLYAFRDEAITLATKKAVPTTMAVENTRGLCAVGMSDGTVQCIDFGGKRECDQKLDTGSKEQVESLLFFKEGNESVLVASVREGGFYRFRVDTWQCTHKIINVDVTAKLVAPVHLIDGSTALIATDVCDGVIVIDSCKFELLPALTPPVYKGETQGVLSLQHPSSPGKHALVVGYSTGECRVFNVDNQLVLEQSPSSRQLPDCCGLAGKEDRRATINSVRCVQTPEGGLIAAAGQNGVNLFHYESGQLAASVRAKSVCVFEFCRTEGGRIALLVLADNQLCLWAADGDFELISARKMNSRADTLTVMDRAQDRKRTQSQIVAVISSRTDEICIFSVSNLAEPLRVLRLEERREGRYGIDIWVNAAAFPIDQDGSFKPLLGLLDSAGWFSLHDPLQPAAMSHSHALVPVPVSDPDDMDGFMSSAFLLSESIAPARPSSHGNLWEVAKFGEGGEVLIFDANTREMVQSTEIPEPVLAFLPISPEGFLIAKGDVKLVTQFYPWAQGRRDRYDSSPRWQEAGVAYEIDSLCAGLAAGEIVVQYENRSVNRIKLL